MRITISTTHAVLMALAFSGCAPSETPESAPIPSVELPAELSVVLREYERAYGARDSVALSRLFADDGLAMPLGRPLIRGGAAAAGSLAREGSTLRLVPVAYGVSDSVAYVAGTFGAEGSANRGGKFVLALKRDPSGKWRVAADIANPNGR